MTVRLDCRHADQIDPLKIVVPGALVRSSRISHHRRVDRYRRRGETEHNGAIAIPRETNLVELADELDISDQAVNERLRRGTAKLVASSLTVGSDAE